MWLYGYDNNGHVTLPENLQGWSFIILTNAKNVSSVTPANTVAGPAEINVPFDAFQENNGLVSPSAVVSNGAGTMPVIVVPVMLPPCRARQQAEVLVDLRRLQSVVPIGAIRTRTAADLITLFRPADALKGHVSMECSAEWSAPESDPLSLISTVVGDGANFKSGWNSRDSCWHM